MIDITFDMRSDSPVRKSTGEIEDPDKFSPTLKRYHRLLWQKPLPSGKVFTLAPQGRTAYLVNDGIVGRLPLASDSIIVSHSGRLAHLYQQMPEDVNAHFHRVGSTIGGYMLFPGAAIDRLPTINQARGTHPAISDRFDLTLECIRRFYLWRGLKSPLREVIARYSSFFMLFESFDNFVEFFHLQDLIDESGRVRFFHPFEDFTHSALPLTLAEYTAYRDAQLEFLKLRNFRIKAWWRANGESCERSVDQD